MLKKPTALASQALAIVLTSSAATAAAAPAASRPGSHFSGGNQDAAGLYQAGVFWIKDTPSAMLRYLYFGNPGDSAIAADFDGDGKTDLAVYRPETRTFWWKRSSDGAIGASGPFGNSDDIPVSADFDGDGKTDIAVYRPSTSEYWFIKSSNQSLAFTVALGTVNGKPRPALTPFVGDFDGDGRSDPGVFDTENSVFYWATSSGSHSRPITGVSKASTPVVANYELPSFSNLGVYDTVSHKFVYLTQAGNQLTVNLGAAGDTPLAADFDGDGKADFAIFSTTGSSATISYRASSTGALASAINFGSSADYALAQPLSLPYYQPAWSGISSDPMNASPGAPQTIYQTGVPNTPGVGPFIPLCLFDPLEGPWYNEYPPYNAFVEAARANFNCVLPKSGATNWQDAKDYSTLYQTAASHGLRVIPQFIVTPAQTTKLDSNGNKVPLSAEEKATEKGREQADIATIVKHVETYGFHSNILAWKLEDEAGCSNDVAERWINFKALSDGIAAKQAEKSYAIRPSITVDVARHANGGCPGWANWNTGIDIKIPSHDNYPFRTGNESSLEEKNKGHLGVPESVKYVATHSSNAGKPIWFTVQAFEGRGSGDVFKMPKPEQLQAQVYAALTHGATGLMYFAFDSYSSRQSNVIGISPTTGNIANDRTYKREYNNGNVSSIPVVAEDALIDDSTKLWETASTLNSEITRLRNVWLSNTSFRNYQVNIQSNRAYPNVSTTPIRTMLKREANGVHTLIAVNLDNQNVKATFDFPGARLVNLKKINANGNYVPAIGINTIAETFGPFQVWIYQFTSAN